MFCQMCGWALAPESRFCAQCGAPRVVLSSQARPANFRRRACSWALDVAFIVLLALIPCAVAGYGAAELEDALSNPDVIDGREVDGSDDGLLALFAIAAVFGAIWFGYNVIATAKGGGLGKRIAGVRVVRARDGLPLSLGEAFGRVSLRAATWLVFAGWLPLLDSLWCLWDEDKQTLHDKLLGTVVIER